MFPQKSRHFDMPHNLRNVKSNTPIPITDVRIPAPFQQPLGSACPPVLRSAMQPQARLILRIQLGLIVKNELNKFSPARVLLFRYRDRQSINVSGGFDGLSCSKLSQCFNRIFQTAVQRPRSR